MTRPMFRAVVAIGAGRTFRRGPERARAFCVLLAALVLALVLLGMAVSVSVLHGIGKRDAARAPETSPGQRVSPVGYLLDTFSPPPLNVVLVQPKGSAEESPPPGLRRWLPIDSGGKGSGHGEPALVGTCAQVAVLGAQHCDAGVTTIAALAGGPRLDAAASFLATRVRVTEEVPSGSAVKFVVAKRGGGAIEIRSLAAKTFADQLRFAQVGDEWAGSAAFTQHQLRWFAAFLWPGMTIFMTGLVLASAESLTRRLSALRPLSVMTEKRTLPWLASGASLLIPLVAAVLTGVVAYLMLGSALGVLYAGLRLSAEDGLEMGIVGLVSAVLGWSVFTSLAVTPGTASGASFEGRLS